MITLCNAGLHDQLGGEVTTGANLKIGYYDQKQAEFKSNKTISRVLIP
jgi:ATP-binding cassette subfamily F protein 3